MIADQKSQTNLKLQLRECYSQIAELKRQNEELRKGFTLPPTSARPEWLTPMEWKLLCVLLSHEGVSYEALYLRNSRFIGSKSATSVLAMKLRNKLWTNGLAGGGIRTVRGWGYAMDDDVKAKVRRLLDAAGCTTTVQRDRADG